jgi:hypothetical protein
VKAISRECNKKKPYQKPNLRVYGDIRTMTQSAGNMGIRDGGSPPTSKTH